LRHFFFQSLYIIDTAFSKASHISRSETLREPVSNVTGHKKIHI
jgi:hypothetical protein